MVPGGNCLGGGSFLAFFGSFLVLGLQEGRKQGRQQPGRIGRKEGRKEGPYSCSHLRWKHWQQRYFLLHPEPKPYSPKNLDHLTPEEP